MPDSGTFMAILRGIPMKRVVWGLVLALSAVVAFVGKGYADRLEALEVYRKEQNGHIKAIDNRLEKIDVNLEWIKKNMK